MWFTCLTTTKLITFFRLDKFFYNFFAEVTLTVSLMARLLFLLFVFDTSKNWLQNYKKYLTYAIRTCRNLRKIPFLGHFFTQSNKKVADFYEMYPKIYEVFPKGGGIYSINS